MAAESDVNKWQNLLNCVIFSKSLPDFWDPCVDRVTYGLINELFDFIDQNNLSSSVIKPSLSLLCGKDEVSDIVKNVFNLKTSVKNLLKKKPQEINKIYSKLYPSSVVENHNFIGKNCCMLGIDLNIIDLCLKGEVDKCFELSNGAVLELDGLRIKKELTWQMFANLIFELTSGNLRLNADCACFYIGVLKKITQKSCRLHYLNVAPVFLIFFHLDLR